MSSSIVTNLNYERVTVWQIRYAVHVRQQKSEGLRKVELLSPAFSLCTSVELKLSLRTHLAR
jgi:hypothetical protein